ncbi:hypothetical protein B0H13DRAFT_516995 [Mycena leptocephala]|nr:hypothetical protein B0H13DRAFT_516995 [Mycena leptocephala]
MIPLPPSRSTTFGSIPSSLDSANHNPESHSTPSSPIVQTQRTQSVAGSRQSARPNPDNSEPPSNSEGPRPRRARPNRRRDREPCICEICLAKALNDQLLTDFLAVGASFLTRLEQRLWFYTSIVIIFAPYTMIVIVMPMPSLYGLVKSDKPWVNPAQRFNGPLFLQSIIAARVILLGVTFSTLRAYPTKVLYDLSWSKLIPHF